MYFPPEVWIKIRGIDVSHYQSNIDWKKVWSGSGPGTNDNLRMVSVKAQEGAEPAPDDHWERNWSGAREAGFELLDAYLFFRPSADPIEQADRFSERILKFGGLRDIESFSLDLESADAPHTTIAERAWACLDRIENNLGKYGFVYTAKWFAEQLVPIGHPLAERPLWVAHYGTSNPFIPSAWVERYKRDRIPAPYYDFWQYGADGSGIVQGIPVGDHVDHDIFRSSSVKELEDFKRSMIIRSSETLDRAPGEDPAPLTSAAQPK